MGFFKNLKFGGGSIGLFDNSVNAPGDLLKLAKDGTFRTEGTFAPGSKGGLLATPTAYLKGLVKPDDGNPNTNDPSGWSPVLNIKALSVDSANGSSMRSQPGFLPPSYLSKQILDKDKGKGKINEYSWNEGNAWIGHLLNSHLESPFYTDFTKGFPSTDTKAKIDETTTSKSEAEQYSARDYYIRFNDQNTDYFRHGLHIEGLTNLKSGKNSRETWDGSGDAFRLGSFKESLHENSDPVMFGFEIIFDGLNSPLLNGAVEDFIAQFSYISEIASKAIVIDDFKRQFMKLFKVTAEAKGGAPYSPDDTFINSQRDSQVMMSNVSHNLAAYAEQENRTNLYRRGKKAYMGYYLQKIEGLEKLVEANTAEAKKYLTAYRKDVIKLSFLEDLSLTMGTLAHLYKMLYWSKPNGKNLIPENLLRFNCEIIISECRNFSRVRKAAKSGDLEILKDNVSRYIYSLRECQFWFDKMSHDSSVDMGNIKHAEDYSFSFDYKYSSLKMEKWVPDAKKFGKYVGYNAGAIWKIGNKNAREMSGNGKFVTVDTSVPRFYTVNTNTARQNGVNSEIVFESYAKGNTPSEDETNTTLPGSSNPAGGPATTQETKASAKGDNAEGDEDAGSAKKEMRKAKRKEALNQFKENAKKAAVNIAKGAASFVFSEVNNQISIRAKMLEDTINKARNLLGMGGLKNPPKRVYPRPYTPHSFGIFFDVRNDLFNFAGNELAGIIAGGMNTILPGTQLNFPFKMPNVGATLDKLTKKFSLYDAEAKLIASLKSKGPKKPFFDAAKFKSKKWAGKTTNKIYNTNTEFKFPATTENVKYGGGFGVKALSYMKPKGTIYTDGSTKPATMLNSFSNPLNNKLPIGTKNFNRIGFPAKAQKYPAPLSQGNGTLKDLLANSAWKTVGYMNLQFPNSAQKQLPPVTTGNKTLNQLVTSKSQAQSKYGSSSFNSIQFPNPPQKYPAPISMGNSSLDQIVQSGTIWSYPVNNKKFGK
jgi:hypothetical protein